MEQRQAALSVNGIAPGRNTLIELSSNDGWKTAKVINFKGIPASTTLAMTLENRNYVINQNFATPSGKSWTIQQVKF